VSALTLVAFVVWEWRQEHPVMEVRLFKGRSFVASNVMMLVLGITLFGSTVLLPQYTQVWMGWSAQQAGEALSPGGFLVILLLPFVGKLVGKVDARWLIAAGFTILTLALFHMAHTLYPGMDFRAATLLRIYQAAGLAFLFVPINTLAYQGIPLSKNNSVSGIVNLSRNLGGDIGIAIVTTLIARRSQFHQARLVEHLDAGSVPLQARLAQLVAALQHAGSTSADATRRAYAALGRQLAQQAQTLAYLDVLFLLGCFTAVMVPLVFLARKPQSGPAMGH